MWKEILIRLDRPFFIGLTLWASWSYMKTPAAQVPFGIWFCLIHVAAYLICVKEK